MQSYFSGLLRYSIIFSFVSGVDGDVQSAAAKCNDGTLFMPAYVTVESRNDGEPEPPPVSDDIDRAE